MLRTLPESHRTRSGSTRRAGGAILSVILHTVVIGAAVTATASRASHARQPDRERERTVVYVIPKQLPQPAARRVVPDLAQRRASRRPPVDMLPPVPRIEWRDRAPEPALPAPVLPHAWNDPTDGRAGDVGAGAGHVGDGGAGGMADDGAPLEAHAVERIARVRGRIAPPPYPAALRESRVNGRVVIRFVVDTLGRVEPASIVVRESSHPLFARAAVSTVERLRFQPAEAGGRRVRMLMELPFGFSVR